jgi:hypothetical protein
MKNVRHYHLIIRGEKKINEFLINSIIILV